MEPQLHLIIGLDKWQWIIQKTLRVKGGRLQKQLRKWIWATHNKLSLSYLLYASFKSHCLACHNWTDYNVLNFADEKANLRTLIAQQKRKSNENNHFHPYKRRLSLVRPPQIANTHYQCALKSSDVLNNIVPFQNARPIHLITHTYIRVVGLR